MSHSYERSEAFARTQDEQDKLSRYREQFHFPKGGELYFAGNSLGLQPKKAREYVNAELDDWATFGVEGHFHARHPWLPYHENLTAQTARLVGAKPVEVVVMNTLTVNLHLMMVSFYRPTKTRFKILIEGGAFPSDQYAVASQARFHAEARGFDPAQAIVRLEPRAGESTLRTEDIVERIEREGDSIALVLLGQVNYLTGQAYQVGPIGEAARKKGCVFGLDLAHGAGNLHLKLHDWNVDFAVWCSYKYLNGGPGTLSGCFVHERHARDSSLPRFAGWWGHDKQTRFKMGPDFQPIEGAEGWQLSNPPILQLAALRASMELFDEATMPAIRAKGDRLTGYLEFLLKSLPGGFAEVVTPADPAQRGSQLSFRVKGDPRALLKRLGERGVICDFREPNVLRAAPTGLYTSFMDVYRFGEILREFASA